MRGNKQKLNFLHQNGTRVGAELHLKEGIAIKGIQLQIKVKRTVLCSTLDNPTKTTCVVEYPLNEEEW